MDQVFYEWLLPCLWNSNNAAKASGTCWVPLPCSIFMFCDDSCQLVNVTIFNRQATDISSIF